MYRNPVTGDVIRVHALNPEAVPPFRAFRGAGGKRRYKRIKVKATQRKVIIVARSAKKGNKKKSVVDDELDELEEIEDLDELDELEDEDEPDDEEDEDDDEDEDEEDDEDELDDLSVKELRAKAKEDGHSAAAIKGLKKAELIDLINEGVDEEDEDDEEDDEEEEPPKKRSRSKKPAAKAKTSRNRKTDGTVGVEDLAKETGKDARSIRAFLRRNNVKKNEDTARYEWPSTSNREFQKLVKQIKAGGVDKVKKESLAKLNASKKKSGAARSKSSGTKRGTTKRRKRS